MHAHDIPARHLAESVGLCEVMMREIWQMDAVTVDGQCVGKVVRELVETDVCMIRYLVVITSEGDLVCVPSDWVLDIEDRVVRIDITMDQFGALPLYDSTMPRSVEEQIYGALDRDPYWHTDRG